MNTKINFNHFRVLMGLALFFTVSNVLAEDVEPLIRERAMSDRTEHRGNWIYKTFLWPKVDDKAILAYWPGEKIDKMKMQHEGQDASLNDSSSPRARALCVSMGFDRGDGYQVFEPGRGETDAAVESDGSVTYYDMYPEYYWNRWVSFGVFQMIKCKKYVGPKE